VTDELELESEIKKVSVEVKRAGDSLGDPRFDCVSRVAS
jgi:hypothetical protein